MITNIDSNNLNQAIAYVNVAAYKSARKRLAYRIFLPTCSVLFFLIFVIMSYGAAELFIWKGLAEDGVPIISNLWHRLSTTLSSVVDVGTWYWFTALFVILIFVIPLVVALLVSFVVSVSYHPNTAGSDLKPDNDNISKKLYQKAVASAEYSWSDGRFILLFSLLFIAGIVALTLHMELQSVIAGLKHTAVSELIVDIIVSAFIIVFALGMIVGIFASLMHLSLGLCEVFVRPKKNTKFIKACKDYWKKTDPEEISRAEKEVQKKQARSSASSYTSSSPVSASSSDSYSGPYVSLQEKFDAEDAMLDGKISNEEYEKIAHAYWEQNRDYDTGPDVSGCGCS